MFERNIYMYHLDAELQKLYIANNRYSPLYVKSVFNSVTRLAFLLTDNEIFVPLSNYLESTIAFDIINEIFMPLTEDGLSPLVFLSTAPNLDVALAQKKQQHGENYYKVPYRYFDFEQSDSYLPGSFRQRKNSASKDIKRSLLTSIGKDIWTPFKKYLEKTLSDEQKDNLLYDIPKNLDGQAYISDYVTPLLPVEIGFEMHANKTVNKMITQWYLESFLTEFDATSLSHIPIIYAEDILPNIDGKNYLSFNYYKRSLENFSLCNSEFKTDTNAFDFILKCNAQDLLRFKHSIEWQAISIPTATVQNKIILSGGIIMNDENKIVPNENLQTSPTNNYFFNNRGNIQVQQNSAGAHQEMTDTQSFDYEKVLSALKDFKSYFDLPKFDETYGDNSKKIKELIEATIEDIEKKENENKIKKSLDLLKQLTMGVTTGVIGSGIWALLSTLSI